MTKPLLFVVQSRSYGRKLQGLKVTLRGFVSPPAEFAKPDKGFPFGKTLLETLGAHFRSFRLEITRKGKPTLTKVKRTTVVSLPLGQLKRMASSRYPLRKDLDQRIVWNMLSEAYPKAFSGNRSVYAYSRGMFRSLLANVNIRQLAEEDGKAIAGFVAAHPQLLGDSKSLKQRAAAARAPVMRAIVSEMDESIGADRKEQYWQDFVRRNYLFLNDEYVQVIEKQNLGIAIRIPDFLLVTSDGYVDVLELKTPKTSLLKYDASHDTYYWSGELSQAISQAENYLDVLTKNADAIVNYLRRQDMQVEIIRPRAYVVSGSSPLLGKKEIVRQFRLLRRPMANVEILTYSDLLTRAKNKLTTVEREMQLAGGPKRKARGNRSTGK